MNSTADAECIIQGNPDISGTGIRLSLYILSLAGPLLSELFDAPEVYASIRSSLGVTGLSLFLTSVIHSVRGTITLFHAICLFHLLCLVEISVSPRGRYPLTLVRLWVSAVLYYLVTCGFLASTIYLFAKAPTYGSQPECNDMVIFVIFGVNIHATSAIFRWILVASLSCLLLGVVASCLGMAFLFRYRPGVRQYMDEGIDRLGNCIPYHLIGRLGGCAYIIAMLELIIRRNNVAQEESVWTFGQVLAMMMLVGPIIEILSYVLGKVGVDITARPQEA